MNKTYPSDLVNTIECKQGAVRAVRFNADGNYCITCGSDKSVKLWSLKTGAHLKTYSGHGYEVLDAQGSCDNSQLCSCGMDKTVVLYDVASGRILRKYRGHAGTVNCVKFNEESTLLLSGSLDSSVRIWDCRSRNMDPVQVLDEAKDSVTSIQVSDYEILTGSADNKVRRYDIRNGKMNSDYIGATVTCVNFTQDGQCTLASTLDNCIKLLDKDTGEMLNEFTGHKNTSYKIDSCLSSNDTYVLSGSGDGNVFIWDLLEAKVTKKLPHGKATVHSLTYHPEETVLVTASEGKIYIWCSKDRPFVTMENTEKT
ncbi:unnamed protein product [Owenia fusiformis]|uniref:WD repeat domain-containing protein 83 n=1 Tax=Owenia fusiformis TaxID=6347 RepID=A0A8J1TQR2_OWEFU|nr:unnamed protein product [Owenia fusiformis]